MTLPNRRFLAPENILRKAQIPFVLDKWADAVCDYYRIKKEQLFSKLKIQECVNGRNIIMYHLHHYENVTLAEAGSPFYKHHSTVIYAIKMVEHELLADYKNILNLVHNNHTIEDVRRDPSLIM